MIYDDVIVYAHPDGATYVALVGEDGWYRWPACQNGWAVRQTGSPTLADACEALEPRLARLALLLSGAPS